MSRRMRYTHASRHFYRNSYGHVYTHVYRCALSCAHRCVQKWPIGLTCAMRPPVNMATCAIWPRHTGLGHVAFGLRRGRAQPATRAAWERRAAGRVRWRSWRGPACGTGRRRFPRRATRRQPRRGEPRRTRRRPFARGPKQAGRGRRAAGRALRDVKTYAAAALTKFRGWRLQFRARLT